jgi:catechol 2,3-dioxygenase-like lactoylglutathione lyase family enzyme
MIPTSPVRTRFEHADPILSVKNMAVSVAYYRDALGFRNAPWGGESFTSVNRDGAGIYLCQGGQGGPGTWVWVGVEDVALLYSEYQATGARIRMAPVNHSWAYEMQVEDPDGHVLRFGSEPRADLPFAEQAS